MAVIAGRRNYSNRPDGQGINTMQFRTRIRTTEAKPMWTPEPTPEPAIVTRQLGSNRGKCRLWIEGKDLADAGWRRGDRFDVEYADCLIIRRNPDGKRKIAGTTDRPIIDTNTDKLTTHARLGGPGDTVLINIMPDVIVVTSS